jgi:hypothetical protein
MDIETETNTFRTDLAFADFASVTVTDNRVKASTDDVVVEALLKFYVSYKRLGQRARDSMIDIITPTDDNVLRIINAIEAYPMSTRMGLLTLATDWCIQPLTNVICYLTANDITK